jgi:hypothetical protein
MPGRASGVLLLPKRGAIEKRWIKNKTLQI